MPQLWDWRLLAAQDQAAGDFTLTVDGKPLRDIQGLIDLKLLKQDERGGRSTSYSLNQD